LKRRVIFFWTAALVACRGILGVEELELADAGAADAGKDALADTVNPSETSTTDTGSVFDAGCRGVDCPKCCRMGYGPDLDQVGNIGVTKGCFCNGPNAKCVTECAAGLCANKPPAEPCGPCIDMQIRNPTTKECQDTITECLGKENCKKAILCLQSCN